MMTNADTIQSVTETKDSDIDRMNKTSIVTVSVITTAFICSLPPIFIPINLKTIKLFIAISQKKQPIFLLFGTVHVICALDLAVALVEGVALWVEIPKVGCEILGACQVTIFLSLSLVLSAICLFRITAVIKPRRYKNFATKRIVIKIITGISISSILVSTLLILTNILDFGYLGPPYSTGCSLFLGNDIFQIYSSLLTTVISLVNLFLTSTFLVIQRYFRKPMTSGSEEVKTMKRGALLVTSVATICHFVCHAPSVITYTVMCVNASLVLKMGYPYVLILDFFLILCPHLYSCVLPLFLVTTNTMGKIETAAESSRQSVMRH
ncbi:hypothetical protein ACHWQZ_G004382 [Mnemiopsis leidyi]